MTAQFTAQDPVQVEDIRAAAARIEGLAVRTPLLSHPDLNARAGGQVWLKPENLQRTGSFKFRGACNAIFHLSEEEAARGVTAYSSGNHAQAVAEAARLRGAPAAIVMPADAPAVKTQGVRARGAEVVAYDRETESREEIAAERARSRGTVLVPPFEHPDVIAGQGTCGLEIFEDLARLGVKADQLACCCSGGGLIAGINLAAEALSPETKVYAVEPAGFDDTARSLAAGERVSNPRMGGSIQDALLTPQPGEMTFAINGRLLEGAVAVTDEEALAAVAFAARTLKLVVEPGGAAALAAVLSGKLETAGKTTVVVLSGGNIDPEMMRRAMAF